MQRTLFLFSFGVGEGEAAHSLPKRITWCNLMNPEEFSEKINDAFIKHETHVNWFVNLTNDFYAHAAAITAVHQNIIGLLMMSGQIDVADQLQEIHNVHHTENREILEDILTASTEMRDDFIEMMEIGKEFSLGLLEDYAKIIKEAEKK